MKKNRIHPIKGMGREFEITRDDSKILRNHGIPCMDLRHGVGAVCIAGD